ncbi:MAG: Rieske 2Fe-2S domain-containing protein [Chloroflexi bacterium]|nr:Rieske 2Fe-2S domain-containing protein [Chloroflexota bacterium]
MSERIKVAQTDQLAPGRGKLVKAKGREIALFNVDGSFYAIGNSCPHSTGPLAEGRLYGNIVTCPPVITYPVTIEDHSIFIEIN